MLMPPLIVLVPLDGSEVAEAALPYAEAIARATGSTLRLFAVAETEQGWPLAASDALREAQIANQRRALDEYLHDLCPPLEGRGVAASVLLAQGEPVEQILAAATDPEVAMVVMATHGRGGVERWYLGSVADKVMRLVERPILLVTPARAGEERGAVRLARIAVPLDGSPLAEAALPAAADLAAATGAAVTLVRVQPWLVAATMPYPYVPEMGELETQIEEADRAYLATARARLRPGIAVDLVLLRGTPSGELLAFFETNRPDLVVMTTHGRGGLKRLVLGSTADRLVRAGLPVLLLRGALPAGAATETGVTARPEQAG